MPFTELRKLSSIQNLLSVHAFILCMYLFKSILEGRDKLGDWD